MNCLHVVQLENATSNGVLEEFSEEQVLGQHSQLPGRITAFRCEKGDRRKDCLKIQSLYDEDEDQLAFPE
jgi:hypothetical protein